MVTYKSLAAALIASSVIGRTEPNECKTVAVWKKICDDLAAWGYSWEIVSAKTEDGYTLQNVHILNETTSATPRPSMIW